MRWLRGLLLALVAGLALVGCSSEPEARVSFVGNSYTSTNDLPGMVRNLAAFAGHDVEVEVAAPDGCWWRDHAAESTGVLISGGDFDFVVFQEQSMVTAAPEMARRESRPPGMGGSSVGCNAASFDFDFFALAHCSVVSIV